MVTRCGTGEAEAAKTALAVERAIDRARDGLGGSHADVGLLFASPAHDLAKVIGCAEKHAPSVDWLACSSAGELTESGAISGGISTMLVAWGDAKHRLSAAAELDDIRAAARRIGEDSTSLAVDVDGSGWSGATTLLLGDGLSPDFEHVVTEVRRLTGVNHQVVGGGAGDDGAMERTCVATTGRTVECGVAALHVVSAKPWGLGIGHGVVSRSERMTVTRAEGNVVHEIDRRPVMDVFVEHAESRGDQFDPAAPGAYLIENELGIYLFDEIVGIRAGVGVGADRGIIYAGEVPEGSTVAIVRGEPSGMIEAAAEAARQAKAEVDGEVAGALVFSCVTRKMVLADRYPEELRAIVEVLGPDVPVAGFASYGEIAKVRGKLGGYHNHTIVIAAIPA